MWCHYRLYQRKKHLESMILFWKLISSKTKIGTVPTKWTIQPRMGSFYISKFDLFGWIAQFWFNKLKVLWLTVNILKFSIGQFAKFLQHMHFLVSIWRKFLSLFKCWLISEIWEFSKPFWWQIQVPEFIIYNLVWVFCLVCPHHIFD